MGFFKKLGKSIRKGVGNVVHETGKGIGNVVKETVGPGGIGKAKVGMGQAGKTGSNAPANQKDWFDKGTEKGLGFAKDIYGIEDLKSYGPQVQDVMSRLKARSMQSGMDPVTAAIMGQRGSAVSEAQRNMASQGVRGGAAANAASAVGRQQDQQIAASLYGQSAQSLNAEKEMLGNMISGTTGLMMGSAGLNAPLPKAPKQQEGFLTKVLGGLI